MEKWESTIERQIREAIEQGVFDDLPGKGKLLDLNQNPFEEPLAGTIRRIFRDNDVTHPLIEARRALESEITEARDKLGRTGNTDGFRQNINAVNREIKLYNLRSPVPNFHLRIIDIEAEIEACSTSRKTN